MERIFYLAIILALTIKGYSQTADQYFIRGSVRNSMGDYTGAIEYYTKAIELDPKIRIFYYYRGNAYDSLHYCDSAIIDYTKAIELNPEWEDPYVNRGRTKYKLQNYNGAIADFTKAIELIPMNSSNAYFPYYHRGLAKYKLKDYGGAIADFTRASEIRPKIKEPYYYKEQAIIEMGDFKGAINYYSKAIELDPNNELLYNYRGNTYDSLHYCDSAIIDYTKAIELNPKWEEPYYNRGILKNKLQDFSGAIADFTKTIEIIYNKDAYFPYYHRGLAKYNLQDYRGAIEDFTKAIEIDPYLEKRAHYYRELAKTELDKDQVGSLTNAFIDSRDGHVYKFIKIGSQTWMAENLAYIPSVSPGSWGGGLEEDYYVYDYYGYDVSAAKAEKNYTPYGVLYNWEAANGSCPTGWHLPNDTEWRTLDRFLSHPTGYRLRRGGFAHFYKNTGSTKETGFTNIMGGCRTIGGKFRHLDKRAYFWSASGFNAWDSWYSFIYFPTSGVLRSYRSMSRGFSVRCIRSEANVPEDSF